VKWSIAVLTNDRRYPPFLAWHANIGAVISETAKRF